MVGDQRAEHRGHARHDAARGLLQHERVVRREHGSRERGHQAGVVDVADDAEPCLRVDDLHRAGVDVAVELERCLVPTGFEPVAAQLDVDVAAAVGDHLDLRAPQPHGHRHGRERRREEHPPAALHRLVLVGQTRPAAPPHDHPGEDAREVCAGVPRERQHVPPPAPLRESPREVGVEGVLGA
nr:hypothetical protein [Barrientosiimonas endolithica]